MPTQIKQSPAFEKSFRRQIKKYKRVVDEVEKLAKQLAADERPGDQIPDVGYETYKVRLPNPSANRGKSGGFRVIYYVQLENLVILLLIYSKTDQTDIEPHEIKQLIEDLTDETEQD